jgi:hypothetical protein
MLSRRTDSLAGGGLWRAESRKASRGPFSALRRDRQMSSASPFREGPPRFGGVIADNEVDRAGIRIDQLYDAHIPGVGAHLVSEPRRARMERALLGEFDAAELYFVWTYGGVDLPIVREAIQRARTNAK